MINAGILGASGYAGVELVRLLLNHPEPVLLRLSSVSFTGKTLEDVYPSLYAIASKRGIDALRLENAEAVLDACDVVFSCLPHGLAETAAAKILAKGGLFIDISADFRFGDDEETFKKWYGKSYGSKELHAQAVYGLPELNREKIRKARLIGNPGCYPTSAELGLYPVLRAGLADLASIVVDSASGVTGAGREPSETTHYPECAGAISPYKVGAHRHQPEIDRYLSQMAGEPISCVFTPHLVPMNRGIVSTIYFRFPKPVTLEELWRSYTDFYAEEPFIRVLPLGQTASNRNVVFSNFCDLSVHLSSNGKTGIVVSTIDNMVKGAAGQAVQNMNLALGLPETAGLSMIPPAF
ncbi:MAG: N-acetyl-gamma-glutamyl-phosphate reductase [Spirochaetes bacterium]|nr:N-acetyl-gamma-glutamyl-phosphate reductase [Spirochaetota bacterium]